MERTVPSPMPTSCPAASRPTQAVRATLHKSKQFLLNPTDFPLKSARAWTMPSPGLGIRAHVQGQGGPHPGAQDGQAQEEKLPRQGPPEGPGAVGGQVGEGGGKAVEEPGEHQAQGNWRASSTSKGGSPAPGGPAPADQAGVEGHLHQDEGGVQGQGGVAKVPTPRGWRVLKDTEMMGETPSPALVFMVMPRARIPRPRR